MTTTKVKKTARKKSGVSKAKKTSKKKSAGCAAMEDEKKYREFYHNAPISFQSLNGSGRFLDINPYWLRTLGYEREEVIGKKFHDFLHPDWQPHFRKHFSAFKKRGYVKNVEFKIKHKDGHFLDIAFEGRIDYNPDGSFRQTYCVFQDVTERKSIEFSLKKKQYYFEKAQEIGKIGMWELDLLENKLVWTDENYRIFGVPLGKPLTYEDFLKGVHPDDRDRVDQEWKAALKGKPYDIDHRLLMPDGQIKWVKEKADLVFDDKGRCLTGTGFTQDITEIKLAQEKREREKETFKALFENAPTSIIIHDKDSGEIIDANQAAIESYGLKNLEELKNNKFWAEPPYSFKEAVEWIRKAADQGPQRFEWLNRRKDGEIFWENVSLKSIRMHDVDRIMAISQDITERKKAENALLEAEARYRIIVEGTDDLVTRVDKEGIFIYVNRTSEKIFGLSPEECVGRSAFDFIHPEDRERTKKSFQGWIDRQLAHVTIQNRQVNQKTGQVFDMLWTVNLHFDASGNLDNVGNIARDITEQEAFKEMKSNLIRNISHALKTPISMIEMAIDISKDSLKDENLRSIARAQIVAQINIRRVRHDISLILEMFSLNMSRLNSEIEKNQRVSVEEIIKKTVKNNQPLIEGKSLKVRLDLAPQAEKILGHERQVEFLVNNIVDNAIKFTDKGSITISSRIKKKMVRLEFKDTGRGLLPEEKSKIFDQFYRGNVSNGGVGLGLSICKDIVASYNGTIEVISKGPGEGTTVIVELPIV